MKYKEEMFQNELFEYFNLKYDYEIEMDIIQMNKGICFSIKNPGWSIKRTEDILQDVSQHMVIFCKEKNWDIFGNEVFIIIE